MEKLTTYQKKRKELAKNCHFCKEAREEFSKKFTLLTISEVEDHGEDFCAAQSKEIYKNCCGHPMGYIQIFHNK